MIDRMPGAVGQSGFSRDEARAQVGPGWHGLIDEIYAALDGLPECWVSDVKEKFGALRVYVYGATAALDAVIDDAEQRSLAICEFCGAPGQPCGPGWIKTVCETHARETRREWSDAP